MIALQHEAQRVDGECLPACASMILRRIGRPTSIKRLNRLLKVRQGIGAPFPNVRALSKLGVSVAYGVGDLNTLRRHIAEDHPVIVSVDTAELPYSDLTMPHVVVVVGFDDASVLIHDPDLTHGPIRVSIGDFDLAWFAMGEKFAVIT